MDALLQRFLPLARRRIETAQAQVLFIAVPLIWPSIFGMIFLSFLIWWLITFWMMSSAGESAFQIYLLLCIIIPRFCLLGLITGWAVPTAIWPGLWASTGFFGYGCTAYTCAITGSFVEMERQVSHYLFFTFLNCFWIFPCFLFPLLPVTSFISERWRPYLAIHVGLAYSSGLRYYNLTINETVGRFHPLNLVHFEIQYF